MKRLYLTTSWHLLQAAALLFGEERERVQEMALWWAVEAIRN